MRYKSVDTLKGVKHSLTLKNSSMGPASIKSRAQRLKKPCVGLSCLTQWIDSGGGGLCHFHSILGSVSPRSTVPLPRNASSLSSHRVPHTPVTAWHLPSMCQWLELWENKRKLTCWVLQTWHIACLQFPPLAQQSQSWQ